MKLLLGVLAVAGILMLGGCVQALGPISGGVTLEMKGPVSMGPAPTGGKVGTATAIGYVAYSFGDASISAAMKQGEIQRVHHVDCEVMNVLGCYARYTTVVYGE